MDFSFLPDPVFLRILEYLPLEDCARAGHVNKRFRQIAQLATSHTKSLDLNERRFRKLNSDQLAVILDLCAPNLERIKFTSRDDDQELASIFSYFECPRLTDIDLGEASIDFTDFDRLVENNPKMESLVWRDGFVGFPDVTSNILKKLKIRIEDDDSLETLIDRCPNLEEIDLKLQDDAHDSDITANIIDQFFASIPQVRRVGIRLVNGKYEPGNLINLEITLVNFWNLSLTSLRLSLCHYSHYGDNLLYKVARSFPNLQQFYLLTTEVQPTDTAIACLGDLQELEVIKLYFDYCFGQSVFDQGIRQLARCKKLRKFSICSFITGDSFAHLLRTCSQLEQIDIFAISKVASSEEMAAILESLAGIPMRNITIRIDYRATRSLLNGEPVKRMIKMLEENDALKIKMVEGGWPPWQPW